MSDHELDDDESLFDSDVKPNFPIVPTNNDNLAEQHSYIEESAPNQEKFVIEHAPAIQDSIPLKVASPTITENESRTATLHTLSPASLSPTSLSSRSPPAMVPGLSLLETLSPGAMSPTPKISVIEGDRGSAMEIDEAPPRISKDPDFLPQENANNGKDTGYISSDTAKVLRNKDHAILKDSTVRHVREETATEDNPNNETSAVADADDAASSSSTLNVSVESAQGVPQATNASGAAEFEFSSGDSSSDSSSPSDSSSSDDDDDDPYELLDARTQASILMRGDGDENDTKGGKLGAQARPRTLNEVLEEKAVKPEFEITPEMKTDILGHVEQCYLDESITHVVVRGAIGEQSRGLETGTILCTADRTVIAELTETFGTVKQPMFHFLMIPADVEKHDIHVDSKIFYVLDPSMIILAEPLQRLKGTDASNINDEEIRAEEADFSDDEAEASFKRMKKGQQGQTRADRNGARPGRFGRTEGTASIRNAEYPTQPISYEDYPDNGDMKGVKSEDNETGLDVDGLYNKLSRPADSSHVPGLPPSFFARGRGNNDGMRRYGRGPFRTGTRGGHGMHPDQSFGSGGLAQDPNPRSNAQSNHGYRSQERGGSGIRRANGRGRRPHEPYPQPGHQQYTNHHPASSSSTQTHHPSPAAVLSPYNAYRDSAQLQSQSQAHSFNMPPLTQQSHENMANASWNTTPYVPFPQLQTLQQFVAFQNSSDAFSGIQNAPANFHTQGQIPTHNNHSNLVPGSMGAYNQQAYLPPAQNPNTYDPRFPQVAAAPPPAFSPQPAHIPAGSYINPAFYARNVLRDKTNRNPQHNNRSSEE